MSKTSTRAAEACWSALPTELHQKILEYALEPAEGDPILSRNLATIENPFVAEVTLQPRVPISFTTSLVSGGIECLVTAKASPLTVVIQAQGCGAGFIGDLYGYVPTSISIGEDEDT